MANIIEEAKTGRSTCRTCREKIEKGAHRFGEEVPNAFDPDGGKTHQWHHLKCAAGKKPYQVDETLKTWEGTLPDRPEVEALIAASYAKARPPYPYAEHATTGKSRCQACREGIEKGQWRVAVARPLDAVPNDGPSYLHAKCAADHLKDAELLAKIAQHARHLSEEEMRAVEAELGGAKAAG